MRGGFRGWLAAGLLERPAGAVLPLLQSLPRAVWFALLLGVFALLCVWIPAAEGNVLWRLPPLLAGAPALLNRAVEFLLFEWLPIEIYDAEIEEYEESPLLKELTRGMSSGVLFCIQFIREILLGGNKTIAAVTSWDFVSAREWASIPALPWTTVTACGVILGFALRGWRLALLVGFGMLYIALFGQWKPSMETLSFVLVAAPVSVLLGLVLGVWAYKKRAVEAALTPLLNVAQTMPHFSYLVPATVLFGVGDHAGAIATVIFATPPMVRLTLLGLRRVPAEVTEAGMMSGCDERQLLLRVLLPTARHDILIGVNQVIMQCLAMAVIASFIGAKGLGFNLLLALNGLRIGKALELGVCIVLLAVMLDRLSLAWADKQRDYFEQRDFWGRHKVALMMAAALAAGSALAAAGAFALPAGKNYFYLIQHNKGFTTEAFWQSGVDWMVENWYQGLKVFNVGLIEYVLAPMKAAFLSMPAAATFALAMGAGLLIGGARSALVVGLFLLFIALTEWWDRALITAYMTTFSVIVSGVFGMLAGSLCAQGRRASRVALLVCDTFQTFPSFIYLIPVIMLFGVTDTSVIVAVIIYATIPAVRYTVEGLRAVPAALQDAAAMSGVTRLQRWLRIDVPLAFPHILLGLNQTVVFALFMVIIGAMIGTDDLGQLILKALSDKDGIGNGLMLGLCVAFIGLAVDHLIQKWAAERKALLGIA